MFTRSAIRPGEDRKAGWLELFYDLSVVAALGASNDAFIQNPSAETASFALLALGALFSVWLLTTLIHNRFAIDGIIYRILLLLQMSGILLTAISAGEGDSIGWQGGLISLGFVFLTIGGMYALARIQIGRPVQGLKVSIISTALGALICFAGVFLSKETLLYIFALALIVTMAPILISFLRNASQDYPLHPDHLRERLGLLFLIAIGESLIHLVGVLTETTAGSDYRFFFLVILFDLALATAYFEGVFSKRRTAHPRLWRGTVFAHFILILGVTAAADEMAIFASTDPGTTEAANAGVFAVAIGLLLIGLTLLEVITNNRIVNLTWVQAALAAAVMAFGLYQIRNGDTQSRMGILLLSIAFIIWSVMRVAISRRSLELADRSN
jgi:low temperature requirement protein LtrA